MYIFLEKEGMAFITFLKESETSKSSKKGYQAPN